MKARISQRLAKILANPVERRELVPSVLGQQASRKVGQQFRVVALRDVPMIVRVAKHEGAAPHDAPWDPPDTTK